MRRRDAGIVVTLSGTVFVLVWASTAYPMNHFHDGLRFGPTSPTLKRRLSPCPLPTVRLELRPLSGIRKAGSANPDPPLN
jgi:hypothetical protein